MNLRHPGRPKRKEPWPVCKAEGCENTIKGGSRGFCHRHYIYALRSIFDWETGKQLRPFKRVGSYGPGAQCLVDGCTNRPCGDGLCTGHWQQRKRGEELKVLRLREKGPQTLCLVPGCSKRAISRGMCGCHAELKRKGRIDTQGNRLRDRLPAGRPRRTEPRYDKQGYVLVWAPEGHPRAQKSGLMLEHRLVMEQALGRYLEDWEIVHHRNGNRSDNRPENLEVMDRRARRGQGHPPGHEYDQKLAAQVFTSIPRPIGRGKRRISIMVTV